MVISVLILVNKTEAIAQNMHMVKYEEIWDNFNGYFELLSDIY